MRCSKCSKEWKLSGCDGPIGNAAPGHFLIVTTILAFIAAVLGLVFNSWGALPIGVIAAFIFAMSLIGCGSKPKADRYQGSECPGCGHQNKIMPWDF